MKKFFKSLGAFFKQNYKPLMAIVLIAVISGGLLALGNDLFYISDAERRERDFKKIYPSAAQFSDDLELAEEFKVNASFGEVVYVVNAYDTDGDFDKDLPSAVIIKTKSSVKGFKGYSEIVISIGADGEIKNLIVSSFGGDDRTSSVNEKYFKSAYIGKNLNELSYFHMGNTDAISSVVIDVSSGATSKATMASVCAAVNVAVWYFREAVIAA